MNNKTPEFECRSRFLCEQRAELHNWCSEGVAMQKNAICAKTSRNVVGSAQQQAGRVQEF